MLREHEHVAPARAQRWHLHVDHVDAEVEILPEAALLNRRLEVAVRGGHETDVERDLLVAADRAHGPLLQRTEELRLQRER